MAVYTLHWVPLGEVAWQTAASLQPRRLKLNFRKTHFRPLVIFVFACNAATMNADLQTWVLLKTNGEWIIEASLIKLLIAHEWFIFSLCILIGRIFAIPNFFGSVEKYVEEHPKFAQKRVQVVSFTLYGESIQFEYVNEKSWCIMEKMFENSNGILPANNLRIISMREKKSNKAALPRRSSYHFTSQE